jgi:pimeloyl-ACP methyl ester carboxylesterase
LRHAGPDAPGPTIVLVHGAGHTADVWQEVQARLRHASVAVDLPGRRDRVAGIADVTVEDAAMSVAADAAATSAGPLVLVGHSAGGVVLPGVAARLGDRVDHLVFVAGLCAPDGERVVTTVRPDAVDELAARLAQVREEHRGAMLDPDPAIIGVTSISAQAAMSIDSLNYMSQTVSWRGVRAGTGRTFVRCLRDRIQSRALQAKLVDNCGATSVIDLDCGHTPARAAPAELAALLDHVAQGVTSARSADPRRA